MKQSEQAQERLKLARAYQQIFSTDNGRLVLYDLIIRSGFMSDPFDENPYICAYNNGIRSFMFNLIKDLKKDIPGMNDALNHILEKEKLNEYLKF